MTKLTMRAPAALRRRKAPLEGEERKSLAYDMEHAIRHAFDGLCWGCLRPQVTEADKAYFDSIDPDFNLPLEATDHLCWEENSINCNYKPKNRMTEERIQTMAALKVLDQRHLL